LESTRKKFNFESMFSSPIAQVVKQADSIKILQYTGSYRRSENALFKSLFYTAANNNSYTGSAHRYYKLHIETQYYDSFQTGPVFLHTHTHTLPTNK
jgi:hypothetical protein